MGTFLEDVRHAVRSFRRSPAFSFVVVATLAVGIAAATLVFCVVNAVLYRLYDAYPDPQQLVLLLESNPRIGASTIASSRSIAEWKASARSFERLGGMAARRATVAARGAEPQSLVTLGVSDDVLPMLGACVAAGRAFTASDYAPGAPSVALLTHALWQQQYGERADAVGRAVAIDGRPHTIVGVLSREFSVVPFFGINPSLVTPVVLDRAGDRAQRSMFAVGRLRPGVSTEQAGAEMRTIAAAVAASDPAARDWQVTVRMARGLDLKGDAGFIVVLAVGVGFVLLIVSANVTNLLLIRGAARAREIATRIAVGARSWRIARQMLTEAAVLATAGSLAGLFLAYWGCRAVSWSVSGTQMAFLDLTLDRRTAAFAALVSVVTALAAGLVPSIRSSRTSVIEALKEGAASFGGLAPGRLRAVLAGVEIALALVLLVGAGLVLRGLVNLRQNDPGFDPHQLAFVSVTLAGERYSEAIPRGQYVDEVLERLARRRDLEVAATSFLPMTGAELPPQAIAIPGRAGADDPASAGIVSVTPGFFNTMRIPVKAGRSFSAGDRQGGLPVAVVNARLVAKWFQGRAPLGVQIDVLGQRRTIVGVVGDVRNFHLNVNPAPTIYLPYDQRASQAVAFVLRARGDLAAAAASVKAEVKSVDAGQVVRGGQSFEQVIAHTLGGFDMTWVLAAVLAAVALGLAAVGLYSVIAYSVVRRTREIGVRIALGASPGRVVREIVLQGVRLALYSAIPGVLLALAVGKLLSFKLHRVSALDPAVLGTVLALVLTMVLAATYLPARRASRIDPVRATRSE